MKRIQGFGDSPVWIYENNSMISRLKPQRKVTKLLQLHIPMKFIVKWISKQL